MKWNLKQLSILSLIATAGFATATDPVIDGQLDAAYGAPIVVQNTQTQFGDSTLGDIGFAAGSELNAAYAYRTSTHLYLFFAGNVETNYNKLTVLVDSKAGGQNRIQGNQVDVDFNAVNRLGDDGTGNGLTFDTGFDADYWFNYTNGINGDGQFRFYINYAEIGGPTGYYVGEGTTPGVPTINYNNDNGWIAAMNNSNVAGVTGGTELMTPTDGLTTGVEYKIPLELIGNPTGDIKICAFINGGGNDFMANQVLPGIGGGGNLGEPRNVNFANIAGDQFFVVPGGAPSLPGDIDGDGDVDIDDYDILAYAYGSFVGDPNWNPAADLDNDGDVDIDDYDILANNYGRFSS